MLGVKKSTCISKVCTELVRVPLKYIRMFSMITYWSKLLVTENCILRGCYEYFFDNVAKCNVQNWAYQVKCGSNNIGFSDTWHAQQLHSSLLPHI